MSGQHWTCHGPLQGQMKPLHCSAGDGGSALGATAGLGHCFCGRGAVLMNAGIFQMWRSHLATTAHRALTVSERPALVMPWASATFNAVSAVCGRCGGACTGCCGRAGQVVCWGCGFAECWSFPVVEALLGNHIAHRALSVCEWPALSMPWATARSNAASAM